jgi:hypothetical protein
MTRSILVALLLALSLSPAAADPGRTPPRRAPAPAPAPAPVPQRPARNYDFTGDRLDGSRVQPDGTTIFGLRDARQPSLIRLRGDFVREIARSAEQVR